MRLHYKCDLYIFVDSTKDHPPRTTIVPKVDLVPDSTIPEPEFPCGGVSDGGMSGTFSSPGYDESVYTNNVDCEWNIRVPKGYQIKMTVDLAMDYRYYNIIAIVMYLSYILQCNFKQ